MNPVTGRRTFVRRITTLATGAGAIFLGLVPEAKTRAATSQAAALAAVAAPVLADAGAAPPSSPLSLFRQNQLYSAVLNDAGVGLLLSSAGVQGRIDPPIEHSEVALVGGSLPQTVVMPVISYATGQRIAVVVYGVSVDPVLGAATTSLRAVVLSTGDVKLAVGGGPVVDSPKPEWRDAYQARYFPDQYLATLTRTALAPTMDRGRLLARWRLAVSAAMIKARAAVADDDGTVLVPDPRLQDCYDQCFETYRGTTATILLTIGLAAFAISFWCILCIMAAVASATVTGPLIVGIIAGKCAYACMFAAGAIAGLLLALQNARTQCLLCEQNCDLQYPPVPKPKPKPGPIAFHGAPGARG